MKEELASLFTITSLIEICHINNGLVRICFSLSNIIFIVHHHHLHTFFSSAACRVGFIAILWLQLKVNKFVVIFYDRVIFIEYHVLY